MEYEYPLFYPCSSKTNWQGLEKQANTLLGLPNEDRETYSKPLIDIDGKYYFVIQPEVSELVDLSLCVPFDSIEFPPVKL